jgi:hypothetical protein
MKRTNLPIIMLIFFIGISITSCKKQAHLNAIQTQVIVPDIKSYIAMANAQNVANYAGDVIVCPGYYLSVYTHFYLSSNDDAPTTICGRKSTDTTGTVWGSEFTVSQNIGKLNVSSVTLYRVDANTINCYFLVKNSGNDIRLYLCTTPNNGTTWSAATQIIDDGAYDIFLNSSIHTVNNGRIVMPVASIPTFTTVYTFKDFCYYSDNGGATWTKSNTITPAVTFGGYEPKVVQLSGDTSLMNIRTTSGFQYFSMSTDNCETWGTAYQSTLESPSADASIVNISGKLVAVHNNSSTVRNPLSISKSLDMGATWEHVEDIENGDPSIYLYSYSSVTVSNGYLLISYFEEVTPQPSQTPLINYKFAKVKISNLSL